ncbi:c-type cytochrome [Mangrovitalea sediminis]|uniref:c-type cytochrome n=1 Tax=Mangrovitalea sediminis TaxID=1982043 RepID=UPI000BE604D8|nr:c-type cytochrome [Mangrovitalea sediminis]
MTMTAWIQKAGQLWLPLLLGLFTSPAFSASEGQTLADQGSAQTPACMSCHGNLGQGNAAAAFPRLAGLSSAYIEKQLNDIRAGTRQNAIMQPIAKSLSEGQIKAVADYYAGLQPQATPVTATTEQLALGREIAVNGLWSKSVPACTRCHGAGAQGVGAAFPELAGQHASYIQAQLKAWQQGMRHNDPVGVMAAVAHQLDEKQVQAVATYLASLPARGDIPKTAYPDIAPSQPDTLPGYFQPGLAKDLPSGKFGESVRRGAHIFNNTHLDPQASQFVGNGQDCTNCHLNGGRHANAAPMWAAWVLYPQYRSKNDKVNTMVDRLQGCFTYSENAQGSAKGSAPPADSQVLTDLMSYMYWQATGAPTGVTMKGRGYPKLPEPPQPFSAKRGEKLFAENCALCHGRNGEGTQQGKNQYVFPPLWGAHAYNWGAGMHQVNTAAAFIRANMPLGNPGSLSVQDAWDLAAFVDSRPRPQDPRFKGNLAETVKAFHANRKMDFYGQTADGYQLGAPGTLEKWMKDRALE